MIQIKDNFENFRDLDHLIFKNKVFSYVYKGNKLIWSVVSKIWKGRDKWKGKEVWKY